VRNLRGGSKEDEDPRREATGVKQAREFQTRHLCAYYSYVACLSADGNSWPEREIRPWRFARQDVYSGSV
jgi:hypothetical protein